MKTKLDKKSVAQILFGAAVFLLAANLVISRFSAEKPVKTHQLNLTGAQIDSIFTESLHSYGIKDTWIKDTGKRKKKVFASYKVLIPEDLSIPVVLTELFSNYSDFNVKLISAELETNGKSVFSVLVNDKPKLKSVFVYNDTIKRTGGNFSFVVDEFELNDKEDSLFLKYPEPYVVLLNASKYSENLVKPLIKANRSFAVLLDDDIPELKYRLRESYSKKRLLASVSALIKSFAKASFFIIDDNSDVYNSSAGEIVRKVFNRRGINLLRKNDFRLLSESENELIKMFDRSLTNLNTGKGKVFIVSESDFNLLLPEIRRFRKTGYKFLHPTEIKLKD